MIKKLIVILLSLVIGLGVEARTVRDFFASEPNNIFMLLPLTTRLDLLDYYDNDQIVQAKNNMGEGTQLITVEDNYLHVRMSSSKTVQMLMVPTKKDTLIAVIETFEVPIKDSKVSFFDSKWYPLVNKHFKMPELGDFVRKGVDKKHSEQLLGEIPFALIDLTFEGKDHTKLVARHGLQKFLTKEEYAPLDKILVPSLTYDLNGVQWKLTK